MARINIILPDGTTKSTDVTPETTVKELLYAVGCPTEGVTVYNSGDTPMPDLSKNMIYYNNFYPEKGFIPALYVKWA